MKINRLSVAAALTALIACPTVAARQTPQQTLDKLLAGYAAQKPVDCISQSRFTDSETIVGIGIVYKIGGTRYLNRFHDGCPQLDEDRILVTRTFGTQLCRGDVARLVDRNFPIDAGFCLFDSFTPYRRMQ